MFKVVKDIQLSKNFRLSEFVCKEGKNEVLYDVRLIDMLQKVRAKVGKPVYVVSGYRSPSYNTKVGGAKNSYHLRGEAADIYINGLSNRELAQVCYDVGFRGIGIYKGGVVHVDIRHEYGRENYWNKEGSKYKNIATFEELLESRPLY